MDKLFLLILTIFVTNFVKSQDFEIKLIAEDINGKTDTIIFGINENSTIGIDESFGEFDIYNSEFDTLDIRVIHRDLNEHNCLRETHWSNYGDDLYFEENIDTKIDLRPYGQFSSIYTNFEILVNAYELPVKIYGDFEGISMNAFEGWSGLHLLNSECETIDTKSIYYEGQITEMFEITDTLTTLVAQFLFEVGIVENHLFNFSSFPNPTDGILNLEFKDNNIQKLIISDITGNELILKTEIQQNEQIDLSSFDRGIYIVSIQTDNEIFTTKIIKK